MSLFNLDGKIALVTGSTDGLGKAIALGLGKANATIVVNGRSSIDKLNRVVEEFNKDGINASGSLCDVTNEAQVTEMVENIEGNVGAIDILVNNAGTNIRSEMKDMPLEKFKSNVDINLLGPFMVSKIVAKRMIIRRAGKIINICSMMSELGRNSVGAYAASKGGLKMLTQNMATEWAKHNIQINGIGPGYFATKLTEPLRKKENPFNDFIINRTPAGRWGNPDELVGAAIFLSSKASDFVNGHILYVDGGILATIGKPANE
ncbi:MAG: gluconate 5-dehydrogenase [Cyclobacteriaceae bacterium]|nr:gluconate 5-dehydrogenase [Cyclobacteriaceae bacterium]